MRKPVLVIMAAGLGSRYGGLKQIAPVDEEGHLIIDFSIFDAARAGFEKVICIIKPELEKDFREAIGDRTSSYVRMEYAYQSLEALPEGFSVPEGRTKPWGTAHAVLCAKPLIDGPFAVINADDFYGRTGFEQIYRFLEQPNAPTQHAMVGYRVSNTLTDYGSVSRGVCAVNAEGLLEEVVERTHIEKREGGAAYTEDGERFTFLPADTTVSMNLWGFQRSMLDAIESRFAGYLRENLPKNPLKCEYFLPLVPSLLIGEGVATVRVLTTPDRWYGVTYPQDMPEVRASIARMKAEGLYPTHLWRK